MRRRLGIAIVLAIAVLVYVVWVRPSDDVDEPPPATARETAIRRLAPSLEHTVDRDALAGHVVDDKDRPVAGARVILATQPPRIATTTGDGSFSFDGVPPARYDIQAIKGRDCAADSVRVSNHPAPVTLRLSRGADVSVRVVDKESQTAIYGATAADPLRSIDTGPDGRARFTGVPPGTTLHVDVRAAGYAPASAEVAASIDLDQIAETTIEVVHGASVSGTVQAPDDTLVGGAVVTIVGPRNTWHGTTMADEHGRWEFPLAGSGYHMLAATAGNYGPSARVGVELDGENPRDDVVLRLEPDSKLTGTVVDTSHQPIAGATVHASFSRRDTGVDVRTDATGHFTIRGLRERTYMVVAKTAERASAIEEVSIQAATPTAVELVVEDTMIAGVVVNDRGDAVAGARVVALPGVTSHWTDDAITDATGHFEIGPLVPGDYTVDARRHEQGSGPAGPDAVSAAAGDRELRLVVHDLGTITGRVVMNGKPLAHFAVKLDSPTEHIPPAVVTSDIGAFSRSGVAPGTWGVTIVGPGFIETTLAEVTVVAGQTIDVGEIAVRHGRKIIGKVVDGDGAPIEGAFVVAWMGGRRRNVAEDTHDRFANALNGEVVTYSAYDGSFELDGVQDSVQVVALFHHNASRPQFVDEDQATVALTIE